MHLKERNKHLGTVQSQAFQPVLQDPLKTDDHSSSEMLRGKTVEVLEYLVHQMPPRVTAQPEPCHTVHNRLQMRGHRGLLKEKSKKQFPECCYLGMPRSQLSTLHQARTELREQVPDRQLLKKPKPAISTGLLLTAQELYYL